MDGMSTVCVHHATNARCTNIKQCAICTRHHERGHGLPFFFLTLLQLEIEVHQRSSGSFVSIDIMMHAKDWRSLDDSRELTFSS